MEIYERIKQRRKELGLSAEKVAEMLGISPATMYRYENNDIKKFPTDVLIPLAKVLHTTPQYLIGWSDEVFSVDDLTNNEISLIKAYREHPEMQDAVNKLLGITFDEAVADDMIACCSKAKKIKEPTKA